MNIYGLVGYPLSHSFSKKYFTEKFENENINDSKYELFEIRDIADFTKIIAQNPNLRGLNVTIPYKESIIKYLDTVHDSAKKIKAVNVIKISNEGKLIGYNSDYFGFQTSLLNFLPSDYKGIKALILGSGGAAKAVKSVLEDLSISYLVVSRKSDPKTIIYEEVNEKIINEYQLIINTTPLGMYPNIKDSPYIPYYAFSDKHYFFDLVYNPLETLFMLKGKARGAKTKNGLEMLHLQAEKAWEIWNS
ncbi:MAG: shikimate dehydrogenase [Cytophagales bacterium]|nr:MAG: shikimate dehydrogenase [Cytophagales bacterium]